MLRFRDMNVPDTSLLIYLKAFGANWFLLMCGVLSVPAGALAVWWPSDWWPHSSAKLFWATLAVSAFLFASYRVWSSERASGAIELEKLRNENAALKRKPYLEALGRQCRDMLAQLSPEGKELLRHLIVNGAVEKGRRFSQSIAPDIQDTQLGMALATGILTIKVTASPTGRVQRQEYAFNPVFIPVLEDLLYV
jgi:hypothetical protein